MTPTDPHFVVRDRAAWWRNTAAHLREHPEDFEIALENIDRWQEWGRVHPGPLEEWRARILNAQADPLAMEQLLDWLAAGNHEAEPLKSCSPFVGIRLPGPSSTR